MGDFHQTETISTLHRLKTDNVDQLEEQLNEFSQNRPIALVLPCLYSELQRVALKNILENLKDITYLNEIVITIGRADEDQFKHAQEYFSVLPQNYKLIWDDGEKIQSLFNLLKENGLDVGEPGKGRATWIAYGYVRAREESEVIALHDCDVLT
ncbi:MAG: glycosyl transferase, partial [Candidatus Dadabacteria bacterium]|nr:glycosyl transferase [Candidatus Dadabacteria bacterium]